MAIPADKVVLSSCILTLGSTTATSLLPEKYGGQGELPSPKLLMGTSLAFFGLSMLADFAPTIAAPLSLAMAMTALTYYGIPVLDNWFQGNNKNPVGPAANHP